MNDIDYEKSKKVISLNFIKGNCRRVNDRIVNTYKMKNDLINKVIDNGEIEMILVRLDKVDCINYNLIEKRFVRWLRLINATSFEELEKVAKGDKVMEHSIEYVKRYLNGPLNHTFEDYIAEKEFEAREEGEKMGEKKGILETAKNLLAFNIDIEAISKATGLTEKEISKITKDM